MRCWSCGKELEGLPETLGGVRQDFTCPNCTALIELKGIRESVGGSGGGGGKGIIAMLSDCFTVFLGSLLGIFIVVWLTAAVPDIVRNYRSYHQVPKYVLTNPKPVALPPPTSAKHVSINKPKVLTMALADLRGRWNGTFGTDHIREVLILSQNGDTLSGTSFFEDEQGSEILAMSAFGVVSGKLMNISDITFTLTRDDMVFEWHGTINNIRTILSGKFDGYPNNATYCRSR
jgi:hypothetical protein